MPARPLRHALTALAAFGSIGAAAWSWPTDPPAPAGAGDRVVAASTASEPRAAADVDLMDEVLAPASTRPTTVWDRLADCESGDWRDGTPIPGTARWDYGLAFDHGDIYEGGLNFHPGTWDSYRAPGMPGHAGQASRAQQIVVAERVLAGQGWRAWPVCSRKIGQR